MEGEVQHHRPEGAEEGRVGRHTHTEVDQSLAGKD